MGFAYAVHENQQAEIQLSTHAYAVSAGGGEPGQGYQMALHTVPIVAFDSNWSGAFEMTNDGSTSPTLKVGGTGGNPPAIAASTADVVVVRKLTPLECERLMGLPDNYTQFGVTDEGQTVEISNTQRYRICGNGIVVNVFEWLGHRLNDLCVNGDC